MGLQHIAVVIAQWFMYMINLRILPYKCFVMRIYLASYTDVPVTVNYAMKNEMEKVMVAPY